MSHRFEHAYALLIAVDQNLEAAAALPAVAADARALRDVLVHPQRCGYAPDHVRLLTGEVSTRQAIIRGLRWLGEKLAAIPGADTTAIIYFSGHGHVDGDEHYLIPYDLDGRHVATSSIRGAEFAEAVARLTPRRLLVVLDCCHAAGTWVKGTGNALPISSEAVPPALFLPGGKSLGSVVAMGEGRAVLSSCGRKQFSYVRRDGQMSLFTYHLIEALTGHAQPQGGAREVLVSDLISHVDRRVPASAREQGVEQTPDHRLTGNFPVALVLGGNGLAKGRAAPDPLSPLPSTRVSRKAKLRGDGVTAQGDGAIAGGRGAVFIGGGNAGRIDTGTITASKRVRAVKNSELPGSRSAAVDFQVRFRAPGRGFGFIRTDPVVGDNGLPIGEEIVEKATPPVSAESPPSVGTPAGGKGVSATLPDDVSVPPATAARQLGFVLEGSAARGLTLLARGMALLTFKQLAAGESAGATVAGGKLDALHQGEQALGVSVTPEDGLAIDGPHTGSAQFSSGDLLQPVSFALRALPESAGEYGVHVEFHHAGARLYEFRLPIIVLPPGRALPAVVAPLAIDLDACQALQAASEAAKPPRRLRLKACFENNLLYLNLDDYVDGEINASIEGFASSIDRARFDVLRAQLATTLDANLYASSAVWDTFDGSDTTAAGVTRQLRRVTGQFAQAGGALYRALREDPKMREILDYIEQHGEAGTRLTIITREVSLAWELLYPQRFDPDDAGRWPLQPERFWGVRFALETQLLGEGDYVALLKTRRLAKAAASLNLNPTITLGAGQPRQIHDWLATTLRAECRSIEVNDDGQRIRDVVVKAKTAATLIYVFCHGSPPPSAGAPRPERLEIDRDCAVSVDQIDDELVFPSAPIIFLNACSAGSFSPLSFSGFLRAFRRKRALGLIAPAFPVPTCFAARFGADVVDACFHSQGRSLAGLLQTFRQQHVQRGNPLPLLYAVQCQVDL
ncbi:caspase family protein [Accumulibacter sp.]|uniref:caspase family protein n=1 Tax=Accumulibacter sp. TaxID=2053492 RepID=UPI0025D5A440|nr:caspase family protein [Accumulibacter sp.]MCM8611762.1 caspase family protein [Accumulibacter sp.]MCM8635647.1 caspase family protein [Accumulibacter sp.]MCM8639234.1 caspase family protein [Accumulibacter sp.]